MPVSQQERINPLPLIHGARCANSKSLIMFALLPLYGCEEAVPEPLTGHNLLNLHWLTWPVEPRSRSLRPVPMPAFPAIWRQLELAIHKETPEKTLLSFPAAHPSE